MITTTDFGLKLIKSLDFGCWNFSVKNLNEDKLRLCLMRQIP